MPKTLDEVREDMQDAIEKAIVDSWEVETYEDGSIGDEPTRVVVTDYVVVAAWTDPATGDSNMSRFTPSHQRAFQRSGLLHEALYNWE